MNAEALAFTHYRCGGNLVEIPDPSWFIRVRGYLTNIVFAQCDLCGLPGELLPFPLDTEHLSVYSDSRR